MGLILHHHGTGWQQVQGCEVDAGVKYSGAVVTTPLLALAGHDHGQAWAVGDRGTMLHFDGRRRTITPARDRSDLLALTGDADRDVAVGAARTVYRHERWHRAPDTSAAQAGLRAICTVPGGGFVAAGDGGTLLRRIPDC